MQKPTEQGVESRILYKKRGKEEQVGEIWIKGDMEIWSLKKSGGMR